MKKPQKMNNLRFPVSHVERMTTRRNEARSAQISKVKRVQQKGLLHLTLATLVKKIFSVYVKCLDDEMVECSGELCPFNKWFHFKCVGLTETPEGDWYCPTCISKKHLAEPPIKVPKLVQTIVPMIQLVLVNRSLSASDIKESVSVGTS